MEYCGDNGDRTRSVLSVYLKNVFHSSAHSSCDLEVCTRYRFSLRSMYQTYPHISTSEGTRTPNLMSKNHELYQLSYGCVCGNGWTRTNMPKREFYRLLGIPAPNISNIVTPLGYDPRTHGLKARYSIHLS